VVVDGVHQHGQPCGRARHLQAAAGQQAGDDTAHDAGDQPEFGRDAGGDGHAHARRQRDQEDDERCEQVLAEVGA
jgi:hypothetical protein